MCVSLQCVFVVVVLVILSVVSDSLAVSASPIPLLFFTKNKEGNNFDCSVTFNGKTFRASDVIKKESEQKVAALILLELDG